MSALMLAAAIMPLAEIPAAYRNAAVENRVPAVLLYAIALTESGRQTKAGLKAWPWTLNIAGDGAYFVDRKSAWQRMQRALALKQNVDIGLMQVSWRYHRNRLETPWKALNPHWNVRIGAQILRRCFDERGSWLAAIGCYHAPNDAARASVYRQRVKRTLARLAAS